jgi:hypothetical protein
MKFATRKSAEFDRMYGRHNVYKVNKRIRKTNGIIREWLYTKMDITLPRMRYGLKEIIPVTLSRRRQKQTAPDCPKYRWV